MRLPGVFGVALLAAASPPGNAQQIAPEVRSELVQLDAVVTDQDGKLVRDLTRDDFEVLEDGKPQRLAHFMLRGVAAGGSGGAAGPPRSDSRAGLPPPPEDAVPSRRLVLLVDDLHIARGNLDFAKQALHRVVAEFLSPDDLVAVVTTASGPVQQFTLDRAVLSQAIARLSWRDSDVPLPRGSRMTAAQAELILRGDRNALRLAARVMVDEPGSIFTIGAPQVATEASPGASTGTEPERAAEKVAERQARGVLAEALRFSTATLSTVEDVLRSMSPVPGRKICLLVSDGFLVGNGTSEERTREMQRLIDGATRSGAVVYALDTRGLVPTGGDAGVEGYGAPPGLQAGLERQSAQLTRETLRGVANDTGGFLVHGTNDLASGLRRMLEDNDAYYLLAYEPANVKRDGRFRKIQVRLPRHRGYTVRTRKGYFATDDHKLASRAAPPVPAPGAGRPAAAAAAGALEEAEARAALAAPVPADGIPVRLSADYVQLPPAGPQAVIRAHVDLGRLRWPEADGRRRATVELVAGVYDADGNPVGPPLAQVAELDLAPAEYKRAADAGLDYQRRVTLRPGRYQVRLVARERTLAQAGGAAEWIEIPDLGQKKLAMSSVFLSSSAPGAGSTVLGGAAGAEAPRDASALRRFKRGDNLYFQIYVYNPAVDDKGSSDVVLQAQIWSGTSAIAASKPQPVALKTRDGAPLPETNEMRLEGLVPGPYELRVVVVDRKVNATAFRKVAFTVE